MHFVKLPLYVLAGIAMLIVAWSAMLLAVVIGAPVLRICNLVRRIRFGKGSQPKPPDWRERGVGRSNGLV